MPKVLCPRHEDTNPSCEVYEESAFCFVCSAVIPLSELGIKEPILKEKYREDLQKRRNYISGLPKQTIRGIPFPCDADGYYICWPDSDYYKQRLFHNENAQSKYRNPSGHSQPLYWAIREGNPVLFVVEGEINALSLSLVVEGADVCSPGSASEFSSKKQEKWLTEYSKYANILIAVDRDAPGTAAAIQLKGLLMSKVPYISILLLETDFNDILVNNGQEDLKNYLRRKMQEAL